MKSILSHIIAIPEQRNLPNIIKLQPSFKTVTPDEMLEEKAWMRKYHVSRSYSRFDEGIKQYNKSKLSTIIF
jgi:hypothetical protein